LFASLKESGGENLIKKVMSKWEKERKTGGEGFTGLTFFHNTKLIIWGRKKIVFDEDSGEIFGWFIFFKFNSCCYIIFRIKK